MTPANGVSAVDFVVDGKTQWTEHNAPYFFNDDHQLLAPWLLGAGNHVLVVRATNNHGATATSTAHVTVANTTEVPPVLVGTFSRTMTQADLDRSATLPGYDPSKSPPVGIWTLKVATNGLISLGDPSIGPGSFEIMTATRAGSATLYGPANWLSPVDHRGGLCEPAPLDHYRWSITGNILTLSGGTNCAYRTSLFDGRWTRTH